ncbi:MAG: hypothetical protein HY069_02250 [Chlamydiia bacterium]|nr:hypothetical protein [Chlamydiia bacterium]
MVNKIFELLDFQGALDNLATIAAINLESPPPLGVMKRYRIVTSEEALSEGAVQWLSGEGPEIILEILDKSYQTILEEFYKLAETEDWEEHRKRAAAAMTLVGESAKILNRYFAYRLDKPLDLKIEERASYKELQAFYHEKFPSEMEGYVPTTGIAFKDFESVRRDTEYELFYIRNEEGEPYFDAEMLRNIKLTVDFQSQAETFEEDPLLKVRAMQDRDLHAAAGQILLACEAQIADFFRIYKKVQDNDLARHLSLAIIALFLTNNPRYLIQNTSGKSCINYYQDFLQFLRSTMQTAEYQKLIAYPPEKSQKLIVSLLSLAHALCRAFFVRSSSIKQEAIGLIHRSMRKGEELSKKKLKGDTIWNQFQIDDEKLRSLLSQFPNGPLFKILDLIRVEQEEDVHITYDPIGQENFPSKLFSVTLKSHKLDVLRLPSPTRQAFIHKAEIIDEFRGFLRSIGGERRLLLVNLQDRDSWKEGVRCRILESLQKRVEFASQLSVLTLPKDTDFYHQKGIYLENDSTLDFIQAFQKQLSHPEESGFFLPQFAAGLDWKKFLHAIHRAYFHEKTELSRENRQDFIEIAYQWIIVKAVQEFRADMVSFTCKDAIDTGSAESALFFGFLQLLSGDFSSKETQDHLRYLFYAPALFIRERAIDAERLNRSLSCLEKCDTELAERGKVILKEMGEFCSDIGAIQISL